MLEFGVLLLAVYRNKDRVGNARRTGQKSGKIPVLEKKETVRTLIYGVCEEIPERNYRKHERRGRE